MSSHQVSSDVVPLAGRPRDEKVSEAITLAALHVYADMGWEGFTFEKVAKRAGVGKPALYRRWDSKEDLVIAAVLAAQPVMLVREAGSLREELLDFVGQVYDHWTSIGGRAWGRLMIEQSSIPSLEGTYHDRAIAPIESQLYAALARAVERREIESGYHPQLIMAAFAGGVIARVLNTPTAKFKSLLENRDRYVAELVDLIIYGLPRPIVAD